jgi:hypothetical protein
MQLHVRQLFGVFSNAYLKNSHIVIAKATISQEPSACPSVIAQNAPIEQMNATHKLA